MKQRNRPLGQSAGGRRAPYHRPGRVPVGRLTGDRAARSEASWPLPKPAAFAEKNIDAPELLHSGLRSTAAHQPRTPLSANGTALNQGPALRLRRGHLQSVVSSPCRSSRAVGEMNVCLGGTVRAAAARQRIFAPVTNRGEPNCYAGCPANRQRECRDVSGTRVLRWHNHCFVGRRVGG